MAGRRKPTRAEPGDPVLTEKVWNRLRHGDRLVRDEVIGELPPILAPLAWQQFQQLPMAQCASRLLALLEPPPASLYLRRPSRRGSGPFDDISSPIERGRAERIYAELRERHSSRLASCPWLLPILAGRARDLALRPDAHGSGRGRRMRRIKGGKHVQRRYREQGWHPLPSVRKAWGLTGDPPRSGAPAVVPIPKL
jgi:hypothetical protein